MAPLSLNVQIDGSVDVGPLDWRRRQIRSAMSEELREKEGDLKIFKGGEARE